MYKLVYPKFYVSLLLATVMAVGCATLVGSSDADWAAAFTRNTQLRTVSTEAATAGKLSKADLGETIKRNDAIKVDLDKAKGEKGFERFISITSAKSKLTDLEAFLKSKGVTVPPPAQPKPK